jgi:8-oxo-dGTP diphosphatase
MEAKLIIAAGTVLWRRNSRDEVEVALIHRPRYDDWSFPKGKLEEGESEIAAAFRETLEETGFDSTFGPELCKVDYSIGDVKKTVRYWSAQAVSHSQSVLDKSEVDQIIWISTGEAYKKLSREGDKEVLKNFENFGAETTALILLRHAKAISRGEWESDDGDRPLAQIGQIQAMRMLAQYLPYGISEIHTSDAVRCYETVVPMAHSLTLDLVYCSDLSEYAFVKNRDLSLTAVTEIIESGLSALVCGHNPVLPWLVKKLIGKKSFKELERELLPGEAWILHHKEGEIVAIDWAPAPSV